MKFKYNFFYLLMLFISLACEEVIQLDIPLSQETVIVIDAILNNSSMPQTIILTQSSDLLDIGSIPVVNNASVSVINLTNDNIFIFSEEENSGKYTWLPNENEPDSLGLVGDEFVLNITIEEDNYSAFSQIKRTTTVDSFDFKTSKDFFTGGVFEGEYEVEFFATDPEGEGDTYWVRTYRNEEFEFDPNEIVVTYDASFNPGGSFDGNLFIPPIRMIPEIFVDGDSVEVELYSITNETFLFLTQISEQSQATQGLFAVPIANVLTNIFKVDSNGGVQATGFFAVCGRTTNTFIVDSDKLNN